MASAGTVRISNPIIDRIPYMVWTYDRLGALDFVNAFWTTYTGLQLADMAESGWRRSLLDVDQYDEFVRSLHDTMAIGAVFRCETRLRHHGTGEHHWHSICVTPDAGESGRLASWTATATERVLREAAVEPGLALTAQQPSQHSSRRSPRPRDLL